MKEIARSADIKDKYSDIINLKHHVSRKHPQMSMEARAAQFAPFAALTGFDEKVEETARQTSKKIELNEEEKTILDNKLQIILNKLKLRPVVTFTYFVKDLKKDGGKYVTVTGIVKKIDEYNSLIILEDNTQVPILDVISIEI